MQPRIMYDPEISCDIAHMRSMQYIIIHVCPQPWAITITYIIYIYIYNIIIVIISIFIHDMATEHCNNYYYILHAVHIYVCATYNHNIFQDHIMPYI